MEPDSIGRKSKDLCEPCIEGEYYKFNSNTMQALSDQPVASYIAPKWGLVTKGKSKEELDDGSANC